MSQASDFVRDGRLPDIEYRTDAPEEVVCPRVTARDGIASVYLHNERDGAERGFVSVADFLQRLAHGEPNLAATGYRANGSQTTISFNKADRVRISEHLEAYLAGIRRASPILDGVHTSDIDGRIDKLRTAKAALVLAENARRLGRNELEARARQRAKELKAADEGFNSPAEQAIAQALYTFEDQQSLLKGRAYRAHRTRAMLREYSPKGAAERMVLKAKPSEGYRVLSDAGRKELSFEAIIDRFPDEFSSDAVEAARARLAGGVYRPSRSIGKSAVTTPKPDEEAKRFADGFMDPESPQFTYWLPHYRRTLATIREAVSRGAESELYELVWKRQDNSVSNAGQGVMSHEVADRLRDRLVATIGEIAADGSPEQFEGVVDRFVQWRDAGELPNVPRLLVARAFAAIHPGRYHTTVDANKQEHVIPWFVEHTGFAAPDGSWARKAIALVEHMDRCAFSFAGDLERRNMFPWFVFEQMRDANGDVPFRAGHRSKSESGIAIVPGQTREITYRHNLIQDRLYALLCAQYGSDSVRTEMPTGTGGRADAVVNLPNKRFDLYEIKVAERAADAVRDAIGQLLEYAYRSGGLEPETLYVVGEAPLDSLTEKFLVRLNSEFNLAVKYLRVEVATTDK